VKHFLIATALVASAISTPTLAADVGVSVTIGQPGFYGRIDIGDYPYPQPRVVYRQPRIVERVYIEREPIYMRVPPGHAKNWPKYCHRYDACGYPVYFVQDYWYEHEYVPHYREYHGDRRDERNDGYREDRREQGHDNGRDHGKSDKGKNNGHGQNH
jgi:hypothetical protein